MRKIIFLTIATIFIACSKEGSGSKTEEKQNFPKRIVQINKNNELSAKIYYENNLLSGIDHFKESKLNSRQKMFYDKNGLMTKKEYYDNSNILRSYQIYHYTGNLVVKRENFVSDNQGGFHLRSYSTHENRAAKMNNLIGTKYYEKGVLKEYYTIEYIDELGSSNSTGYDAQGNKIYVETWVKDSKIAFDKYFGGYPYQHEHNNISITHKNFVDDKKSWSYTSVFTYDEQGHPLKSVKTNSDKTVETYEYIWEEIKK
ncbi:MAG: hypothetical protein Q4A09_04975 [Capnocytophaga felis]|nr:hypothetical protein [Capnocytophaga felis]